MTINEAICDAMARLHSKIDAETLAAHALGETRSWVLAHAHDEFDATSFHDLVGRRERGEPVAYITGHREFYGLDFIVSPAVLIPRPETELLVDVALGWLKSRPDCVIVDAGTGSGCIAVAMKRRSPKSIVIATDSSIPALEIAAQNARRHNCELLLTACQWLAPFANSSVDAVVSNPPYVAAGDTLPANVRLYEPSAALYAAESGYECYEALIPEAFRVLRHGGTFTLEVGAGQAERVSELMASNGFSAITSHNDLARIERVVTARRDG